MKKINLLLFIVILFGSLPLFNNVNAYYTQEACQKDERICFIKEVDDNKDKINEDNKQDYIDLCKKIEPLEKNNTVASNCMSIIASELNDISLCEGYNHFCVTLFIQTMEYGKNKDYESYEYACNQIRDESEKDRCFESMETYKKGEYRLTADAKKRELDKELEADPELINNAEFVKTYEDNCELVSWPKDCSLQFKAKVGTYLDLKCSGSEKCYTNSPEEFFEKRDFEANPLTEEEIEEIVYLLRHRLKIKDGDYYAHGELFVELAILTNDPNTCLIQSRPGDYGEAYGGYKDPLTTSCFRALFQHPDYKISRAECVDIPVQGYQNECMRYLPTPYNIYKSNILESIVFLAIYLILFGLFITGVLKNEGYIKKFCILGIVFISYAILLRIAFIVEGLSAGEIHAGSSLISIAGIPQVFTEKKFFSIFKTNYLSGLFADLIYIYLLVPFLALMKERFIVIKGIVWLIVINLIAFGMFYLYALTQLGP